MKVEIKADSVNPRGERIVTMLGGYPRFIHAEHLRHRMFSFSVASSRAIPFARMLTKVEEDPVMFLLLNTKLSLTLLLSIVCRVTYVIAGRNLDT